MSLSLRSSFSFVFLATLAAGCVRPNGNAAVDMCAAGTSCPPVETPVPAPFDLEPTALDFGTVTLHSMSRQTVSVHNPNPVAQTVAALELIGADADQFALPSTSCLRRYEAGEGCDVDLAYVPNRGGVAHAELRLTDERGRRASVALQARVGAAHASLEVSPKSWDFHELQVGGSIELSISVSNTGDGPAALGVKWSGDDAFSFGTNCGAALTPGSGCGVGARFAPRTKGTFSAEVSITDGAGPPIVVSLHGTGSDPAALKLTANGAISDQFIGDPGTPVTYHVANSGGDATGPLAVALAGDAAAQYVIDSDGCSGRSLAGYSGCDVVVRFAPTVAGLQSAQLTVSGAPGGKVWASLLAWARWHSLLFLQRGNPDFGKVSDDRTQRFDFYNDGDEPTGIVEATIADSAHSGFSIVEGTASNCLHRVIAKGEYCSLTIAFTTRVVGSYQDQLTITGPHVPMQLTLKALFATDNQLRIRPFFVRFESYDGKPQTKAVVVSNVGTVDLGPVQLQLAGDGFAISADACTGTTLASGDGCIAQITFTPTKNGDSSTTLEAVAGLLSAKAAIIATVKLPPQP